jgi:hypothetical protein
MEVGIGMQGAEGDESPPHELRDADDGDRTRDRPINLECYEKLARGADRKPVRELEENVDLRSHRASLVTGRPAAAALSARTVPEELPKTAGSQYFARLMTAA